MKERERERENKMQEHKDGDRDWEIKVCARYRKWELKDKSVCKR